MKKIEKDKAIGLRKQGHSLKYIATLLNVSKASVSLWVRNVSLSSKQLQRLAKIGFSTEIVEKRRMSRLKNENVRREVMIREAEKSLSVLSLKDLKLIGIMLYWAEGGKTQRGSVRFSNSNPEMIQVMMCFFRRVCTVKEERFRGHIHTHSHINVEGAEKYWEHISGIPRKQFFKTYAKPSKSSKNKKDSLPFGTFDIYVSDTQLFLKILGWTRKVTMLAKKFS